MDRDEGGRPVRIRGTLADVTVRKAAEEELRVSEERGRRISEATSEGIGFSQDGVMIDANAQLAEMLGYAPGEPTGKPVVECAAPEDREKVLKAIRGGHPAATSTAPCARMARPSPSRPAPGR